MSLFESSWGTQFEGGYSSLEARSQGVAGPEEIRSSLGILVVTNGFTYQGVFASDWAGHVDRFNQLMGILLDEQRTARVHLVQPLTGSEYLPLVAGTRPVPAEITILPAGASVYVPTLLDELLDDVQDELGEAPSHLASFFDMLPSTMYTGGHPVTLFEGFVDDPGPPATYQGGATFDNNAESWLGRVNLLIDEFRRFVPP